MDFGSSCRNVFCTILCIASFLLIGFSANVALAQNPNSGTTASGQLLTVYISSPEKDSLFIGSGCQTEVQGLVTLGPAVAHKASVLYVLDLSGSTGDPTNWPPIDVNGDSTIDALDDYNNDGSLGDILDAEIAAAIRLNATIASTPEVEVGVIGYASKAIIADVSPDAQLQSFAGSPSVDLDENAVADIEDVLRSMDSDPRFGGLIGKFTETAPDDLGNSTNYRAALEAIVQAFSPVNDERQKIAFFLSDGDNRGPDDFLEVAQLAAEHGIVIYTLGITPATEAGELGAIANATGGVYVPVDDPEQLSDAIVTIQPVGISHVAVNGQSVALSPVGTFATEVALETGANTITATATASDSTAVTAGVPVICADTNMTCSLSIVSPLPYAAICGDSARVVLDGSVVGGVPPIASQYFINDIEVASPERTTIVLDSSERVIKAVSIYTDALGTVATCEDSIIVSHVPKSYCAVKIVNPVDGAVICGDSAKVVIRVDKNDAVTQTSCFVNGEPLVDNMASIFLDEFETAIVAQCTVVDSCGNTATCADSIIVMRSPAPVCTSEVVVPADGATICDDSVKVLVASDNDQAIVNRNCRVNGLPAIETAGGFGATIPFSGTAMTILAECVASDTCGSVGVCRDSIVVKRPAAPVCSVRIISPRADGIICDDSVFVHARTEIVGGAEPLSIECYFNGFRAVKTDSGFIASLSATNLDKIVASCRVTDSCGSTVVCDDSVEVESDNQEPYCSFERSGNLLTGSFFDPQSGIAEVVAVDIYNGVLTVEDFEPGSKKVDFQIEVVNPNRYMSFSIDALDVCGNKLNCDPVFLNLTTDARSHERQFSFPSIDRYFEITNKGLSEIRVTLNGQKFKLSSEASAASQANTYKMPLTGKLILDLMPYLAAEGNDIWLRFEGRPGTSAEVFISDEATNIDHVLELQEVPEQFELAQNYPNPFNPKTNIKFGIPSKWAEGILVKLRIYNLRGKLVRNITNEVLEPGIYTRVWDGQNSNGETVSSGIYIYRLDAGEFSQTRRMLFLK